jgi:hypothetical protein
MTDQDINKLIAEKIMGRTVIPAFETYGGRISTSKPGWGDYDEVLIDNMTLIKVPDFCNDLNAAFEAFHKLQETEPHIGVYFAYYPEFKKVAASFVGGMNTLDVDNEAKALCLAMLESKRVKVEV